jgi:hypothetical protein
VKAEKMLATTTAQLLLALPRWALSSPLAQPVEEERERSTAHTRHTLKSGFFCAAELLCFAVGTWGVLATPLTLIIRIFQQELSNYSTKMMFTHEMIFATLHGYPKYRSKWKDRMEGEQRKVNHTPSVSAVNSRFVQLDKPWRTTQVFSP